MKNQQAVKSFLFLAVLLCGTFSACGKAAAAGNAKSFFKPETAASSSKDGSIFPGGECTSCNPKDKDGSIFPGGSCVNCPTTKCVNCEPKNRPYGITKLPMTTKFTNRFIAIAKILPR